jgi:N6-L-threonylcarbamoyladenine synthase
MSITILAIESSCDDTSAAILKDGKVLNNIVATQSVHEKYGGIVPELASRAHQQNIVPAVHEAMKSADITMSDLSAVAYTKGPGLLGSLLVGSSFAKGVSMSLGIPLIEINHMEAHILSHFIDDPRPVFPFLCLTVSGGHTQLVIVEDYLRMKVIGESLDDAVGEAFDKTAKLLGLPYPGGPLIDSYAAKGDPSRFTFPPAEVEGLNFSFSGIKTAILYFLQRHKKENPSFIEENMADICAGIQASLVNMLMKKLIQASEETGIREIAIAGGVSANSGLRQRLKEVAGERDWNIYIPAFQYCTDNAGMIAMAAYYKYRNNSYAGLDSSPSARLKVGE